MRNVLSIVLAGGEGKRLAPLTRERSKPAVYFGGRYRLVDFVLSNLVNSGFARIKVLTQYRATSLVRHLSRSWPVSSALTDDFIEVVPAAMNLGPTWFRGTADAIWQNLDLLRDDEPEHVLIFGSDHVYKMDVSKMVQQHKDTGADLTVAALPVPRKEATGFGCLAVDAKGRITAFVEKPANPPAMPGRPDMSLVSMGNYAFRTTALVGELRRTAKAGGTDFGKDILSSAHQRMSVYAYDFSGALVPGESERGRGYWRDVGTLDAYFEASMDIVGADPHLDLYNSRWPIRGVQVPAGPAKFVGGATVQDSIVGAGTILRSSKVERSVVFYDVDVADKSALDACVVFPAVHIGTGCRLKRCIIDKGVSIPDGTVVGEDLDADKKRFSVSEAGVVVISRADLGQIDEYDQDADPPEQPKAD